MVSGTPPRVGAAKGMEAGIRSKSGGEGPRARLKPGRGVSRGRPGSGRGEASAPRSRPGRAAADCGGAPRERGSDRPVGNASLRGKPRRQRPSARGRAAWPAPSADTCRGLGAERPRGLLQRGGRQQGRAGIGTAEGRGVPLLAPSPWQSEARPEGRSGPFPLSRGDPGFLRPDLLAGVGRRSGKAALGVAAVESGLCGRKERLLTREGILKKSLGPLGSRKEASHGLRFGAPAQGTPDAV